EELFQDQSHVGSVEMHEGRERNVGNDDADDAQEQIEVLGLHPSATLRRSSAARACSVARRVSSWACSASSSISAANESVFSEEPMSLAAVDGSTRRISADCGPSSMV